VRSLLVGAGAIARQHLGCLTKMAEPPELAVADLSPISARVMADRFGIRTWSSDYAGLLEDFRPDVVHVTTPPAPHAGLAQLALSAGAHVIVEKPLTTSLEQSMELLDLATRLRLHLVEDYNYVFNSPAQRTLRAIKSGQFGDVVHVEINVCHDLLSAGSPYLDRGASNPYLDMRGGAIADFLPHLASLAYFFIGRHDEVETLWFSRDKTHSLPADEFRALVRSRHISAQLSYSSHSRPEGFSLTVHGTKMRARLNLYEPTLSVERVRAMSKPLIPVVNGLAVARSAASGAFVGLGSKLSGGPAAYAGLWNLLREVYDSLAHEHAMPITIDDVRNVNRLIAALVEDAP
jgi:predicted dehydrogenase